MTFIDQPLEKFSSMLQPAQIVEMPSSEENSAPVRFVWRADADGRFTEVSPELAGMVGKSGEIVGRTWQDLSGSVVDDPDGVVASAFANRDTWSGQVVYWATERQDLRVAVDFAGLPVFGADRQLLGFRGFGLLRPDLVREPVGMSGPTPVDLTVGEFYAPSAIEPRQGGWFNEMRQRLMAHLGGSPAPAAESRPEPRPEARPESRAEARPEPEPVAEKPGREPKRPEPKLSESERSAFREIARALGRADGDPPEAAPPVPKPVAEGREDDRIRRLERELADRAARIRDLEERLEAGRREHAAAARPASKSNEKAELLAKLARDTRAPLDQIIAFSGGMLEERLGPLGSPAYKGYLKDMRESAVRIADLIDDLAELAKIEAGRLALSLAPANLNDLISTCVGASRTRAARDRVVIRMSLAEKLPPVTMDVETMKQVVSNLLTHATAATEAGGQVIVSTILTDGGDVVFRVRDGGTGEALAGLARSRVTALIEANGGKLTLSGAAGQGTLVEVSFPPVR